MSRVAGGTGRALTFYEVLGVDRNASRAQIGRGFRRAIQLSHPDLNPQAHAIRETLDLLEAWKILRDPAARADYDAKLSSPRFRAPGNVQFMPRSSRLAKLTAGGLDCVSAATAVLSSLQRRSAGPARPCPHGPR